MELDSQQQSIKVAARVRPILAGDPVRKGPGLAVVRGKVQVGPEQVEFDFAFGPESDNRMVYQQLDVQGIVQNSMRGFTNTVIAYGQQDSGKSHTVFGGELESGLLQTAVHSLFAQLQKGTSVKASFFELYDEELHDLLNQKKLDLNIRYDSSSGFYVENLVVVDCESKKDLLQLVSEGLRHRREEQGGGVKSHTVVLVWIKSERLVGGRLLANYGKLSFVDLAGGEKGKSEAQGRSSIKKSLFTLGKVIKQLSERSSFVSYRESKLTMLLMDSLGGGARTLLICCIAASASREEAMATMQFACRMRQISNRPRQKLDQKEEMIARIKDQLQQLKLENSALKESYLGRGLEQSQSFEPSLVIQEYRARIKQLTLRNEQLKLALRETAAPRWQPRESGGLKDQIVLDSKQRFEEQLDGELAEQSKTIRTLENRVGTVQSHVSKIEKAISIAGSKRRP